MAQSPDDQALQKFLHLSMHKATEAILNKILVLGTKMGCDIHPYGEVLQNGKWVAEKAHQVIVEREQVDTNPDGAPVYREYMEMPYTGDDSRNYWLFGLLAKGVRAKWDASFEVKNFPDDASDEVTRIYHQWRDDAHSANWLTVAELRNKAMEMTLSSDPEEIDMAGELASFIAELDHPDDINPEHRRIVFWFDN